MMTRDEIIKEYEAAVAAHAAAAAAGIEGAGKSYELFKAGLDALRPVSREQVEKVWRGEWTEETYTTQSGRGRVIHSIKNTCSDCGKTNGRTKTNFCPACGAPMTDKAVQMVIERMDKCINLT